MIFWLMIGKLLGVDNMKNLNWIIGYFIGAVVTQVVLILLLR